MEKIIDLHCHTNASDGDYSPEALIRLAAEKNISAVGLADHDSVSSMEEALKAGEKYGVEIVPGVELSTTEGDQELHLLGYYISQDDEWFVKLLQHYKNVRVDRAKEMISRFKALGYQLDFEELQKNTSGSIGKPHVAELLIKKHTERLTKLFGKTPTISEVIEAFMIKGKPIDVPKEKLSTLNGIKYIKKLQGVPVLAHPGYDLGCTKEAESLLIRLKDAGLQGIEGIYFVNDENTTKKCIEFYTAMANKLRLVLTGGSDFHGDNKSVGSPLGLLGTPFHVPYQLLDKLKKIWQGGKVTS